VKLIAGGGAGHEPAHGGYVGEGMLDGAVSGNIFASPSARQIEECARLALASSPEADGGTQELLVIINNYTGDVLNFGLAIERIKNWEDTRVNVESIVVADDVSIGRAQGGNVGRRGLAGNILVCKILGAVSSSPP
jgi:dihydroxyacetone kinase